MGGKSVNLKAKRLMIHFPFVVPAVLLLFEEFEYCGDGIYANHKFGSSITHITGTENISV